MDDHPRIRDPLAVYLRRQGLLVRTAGDAAAMNLLLRHERFDAVVLDVMLPDGNGCQLCGPVRARFGIPVILLTARDSVDDRVRGLDAGADDYVVKPFDPRELLARLHSVRRRLPGQPGQARMSAASVTRAHPAAPGPARRYRFDGWRVDAALALLWPPGKTAPLALGKTETRLLQVLLHHANQVLSRDELLELTRTQGRAGDLAFDRTIDRQISRLRDKLQHGGVTPLRTVRGQGYMLLVQTLQPWTDADDA